MVTDSCLRCSVNTWQQQCSTWKSSEIPPLRYRSVMILIAAGMRGSELGPVQSDTLAAQNGYCGVV
jgi:hypothetical protein